jgi:beta-galactosidase
MITMICFVALSASVAIGAGRQSQLFDKDWKFQIGDNADAAKTDFDDSSWRKLNLPHDYSIEGPAGSNPDNMDGPFDKASPAGGGGGFLDAPTAWYRKTFTVPASAKGQRVSILFDGVYMNSDVYLNGKKLGNHPYRRRHLSARLSGHHRSGAHRALGNVPNDRQGQSGRRRFLAHRSYDATKRFRHTGQV